MSIPTRLSSYLDQHGVPYEICPHRLSRCSDETARSAHIPPHQLAKSVILEDDDGYVMAVVPGDRNVQVGQLARLLGRRQLRLSDEASIARVFDDCHRGAVPALGMAWGVETIVDDELDGGDVVYVEAGDHESLLRIGSAQFQALMRPARHGHFAGARTH
jgi:Ala-tRNA(Pro) deacylase